MSKIVQLTENSWLVKAGIDESGLLFERPDGFLMLQLNRRLTFADEKAVKAKIGKLPRNTQTEEVEISNINGYPVRHDNVKPVDHASLPTYNKGTKVIFVAGYWCVKFDQGWSFVFCPKLKTLEEYETVGPFKNKLEMMSQLNKLKLQEQQK